VTGATLLSLLHLCDSLFPSGGFAHSDGLEAAAAEGRVAGAADLERWIDACLHQSIALCDGLAVLQTATAFADRRWADIVAIDEEVRALRPSATSRAASRGMGRRVLRTWREIYPQHGGDLLAATGGTLDAALPVAFGVVCGSIGIAPRAAVEAFAYTRLAATASCAMRLLSIGQHEAHATLACALRQVPGVVDEVERHAKSGRRPGAFTPCLDITAMSQQYVHSRLFLS
jgi:urease accessory protein